MLVSLGNNFASLTWEQLCQSHLGTIVPVSLKNNCVSLTWEQLCQSHLGTIAPVPLENNCASFSWKQLCQSHLGTIVPVSLGNNWTVCTKVVPCPVRNSYFSKCFYFINSGVFWSFRVCREGKS